MLPNFIIIGAAKSATTWLMIQLGSHPDIYVHNKEIHYFSSDYSKGLKWYEKHFRAVKDEVVIGENSNGYLPSQDAPVRIKKLIPDVKLIVSLRNPIERAYSAYCMHCEKSRITCSIEDYLDPELVFEGNRGYLLLRAGLYAKHLKRYFNHFNQSQIEIMIYDDLLKSPKGYIKTACDFLGVDYTKILTDYDRRENARRTRSYPTFLEPVPSYLEKIRIVPIVLKNFTATKLGMKIREAMQTRQITYPSLTEELKNKLIEYYTPDIIELETIIKRNLNGWYRKYRNEE